MSRLVLLLVCLLAAGAARAQGCPEIRFERGAYSGEVAGVAPAEGVVCHAIGVRPGQRMRVEVLAGRNTAFTIPGVADARGSLTFVTDRSRYRIDVFQLFRAAAPERYRLLVTVR